MKRTKIRIGFVADYLNSEYSECLISGITTCCKEHNVELLIYQIGKIKPDNNTAHDYQYLAISSQITENNVDGIIISSGTQLHGMSKSAFTSYLRSYKPLKMVSLAHEIPGIPSIICDAKKSLEALVHYLVKEQGCKKFGIMSVESDSKEMNLRAEIIKEELKKNKISSANITLWKSNFHYASAYGMLNDYYTKKKNRFDFDAIIAMNDDLAFACLDFCSQRANLRVPEDIVVTGFVDMQRASFFTPTLTTVNQQVYYQGYKAALTLINQINCEEVPQIQTIEAKAILRESTDKKKTGTKQFKDNEYITIDMPDDSAAKDRYSVTEWFNKRQQVFQAALMDTYIQLEADFEEVGKFITHQLSGFGLQAAAVVLYEQPAEFLKPFEYFNLPGKAKLISCFDYSKKEHRLGIKLPLEFDPSECIIPEGYLDFSSEGFVAMSLFHNTIQYGYILMKRGHFDTSIYDLIAKAVATQIDESFTYSQKLKEKQAVTKDYTIINQVAHIDYLTGLKNNRGFNELGETLMKYSESMGQNGLILYFNLKDLKKINDTFGHSAGDRIIKAFGEILVKHFRSNDLIARLGGDKFAVISPGFTVDSYKRVKNSIDKSLNDWKEENSLSFDFAVSIGFVMFPSLRFGYNLPQLMAKAEDAMLKEKNR